MCRGKVSVDGFSGFFSLVDSVKGIWVKGLLLNMNSV